MIDIDKLTQDLNSDSKELMNKCFAAILENGTALLEVTEKGIRYIPAEETKEHLDD